MTPGGPGAPGRDFLIGVSQGMPAELTNRYDVVAFDPRGVAGSRGLTCGTGQDLTASLDDPIGDQLRSAAELAVACRSEAPDLLPTMTTVNVARDLDQLRQALGEERLTYLGFSRGTLGAVYAELHPDRVGRLVLDGAADPSLSYLEWVTQQVVGVDASLQRFFAWCDADATCRFPGVSAEGLWMYLDWRSTFAPLPTADSRQVTASQFQTACSSRPTSESCSSPSWGRASEPPSRGDASLFADLFEQYIGLPAGTCYAFVCGDEPTRPDPSEIQGAIWRLIDEAPHIYWALREVLTCGLRADIHAAARGGTGRRGDPTGARHRQPVRPGDSLLGSHRPQRGARRLPSGHLRGRRPHDQLPGRALHRRGGDRLPGRRRASACEGSCDPPPPPPPPPAA